MSDLHAELKQAAEDFVATILDALKSASLNDIVSNGATAPKATVRAVPVSRGVRGRPGRPAKAAPATRSSEGPARRAASGKRHRATAEEVQEQKDMALVAAKQLAPGFSKGEVMKKAGSKEDLGRALSLLVADGVLTKKGDRRNTRYWVK